MFINSYFFIKLEGEISEYLFFIKAFYKAIIQEDVLNIKYNFKDEGNGYFLLWKGENLSVMGMTLILSLQDFLYYDNRKV